MFLIIRSRYGSSTQNLHMLHMESMDERGLPETWGEMDRHISMSLFESVVLFDVVKVVTANHDGSLHLHFTYFTSKNSTSDLDCTDKWAFLVDVLAFFSFTWRLETKTDFLDVPQRSA